MHHCVLSIVSAHSIFMFPLMQVEHARYWLDHFSVTSTKPIERVRKVRFEECVQVGQHWNLLHACNLLSCELSVMLSAFSCFFIFMYKATETPRKKLALRSCYKKQIKNNKDVIDIHSPTKSETSTMMHLVFEISNEHVTVQERGQIKLSTRRGNLAESR